MRISSLAKSKRFGQVNRSSIPDRYDLRSRSHGYQPELVRTLRVLLLLALLINAQTTQWERNRQEFDKGNNATRASGSGCDVARVCFT
jgi:hypothetical protein